MPLTGFKCPSDKPTAGTINTFDHCVHKCPHQCQPDFVLATIADREVNNEHKGDMISPTALSGCARRLKLTRTVDYALEPQKLFDATRGGIIHGFAEGFRLLPGVVQERRIYKTITSGPYAPWVLSGRVDYVNRLKKRISDFKTMKESGLYVVRNKGFKEEHLWQLNLYRWLLDGGHVGAPDGPQVFEPIEQLQLHYFLMDRVISTGTRYVDRVVSKFKNKADVNYGKKYGCETSRVELGANEKGQTEYLITFDIPAVPIKSNEEVEQYLVEHGPELVKAFREPDYIPDGVMGDKEHGWQCNWCEVQSQCMAIESTKTTGTFIPTDSIRRKTTKKKAQ